MCVEYIKRGNYPDYFLWRRRAFSVGAHGCGPRWAQGRYLVPFSEPHYDRISGLLTKSDCKIEHRQENWLILFPSVYYCGARNAGKRQCAKWCQVMPDDARWCQAPWRCMPQYFRILGILEIILNNVSNNSVFYFISWASAVLTSARKGKAASDAKWCQVMLLMPTLWEHLIYLIFAEAVLGYSHCLCCCLVLVCSLVVLLFGRP